MKYLSNTELLSEFISLIRFPLIVLVVLIHSHFLPDGYSLPYNSYISEYPIYCNISFLCSELIARIAVPLFFMISGYLFFKKNYESFGKDDYKEKIRNRVYSLLIPYVLWNSLIFIFMLLIQVIRGGGFNYSFYDYFRVFWDIRNGMPFCYQMWYIRDLIVITLISPIIYHLLKNRWVASVILVSSTAWWLVDIDNVRWYLNSQSVLFFCIGSCCAIYRLDIVEKLFRVKKLSYIAALIMITLVMISFNTGFFYDGLSQTLRQCIYHLCILTLLISFTIQCLVQIKERQWKANSFLLSSSFFIYGFHAIAIGYIYAFVNMVISVKSDIQLVLFYFFVPLAAIVLGLLIFAILKKVFPKFTVYLIGGRL